MAKRKSRGKTASKTPENLSVEATALARYQSLLSPQDFAALQAELTTPLRSAIRMNPLKEEPAPALTSLAARYGWEVQPVPYCPTGWWLEDCQVPASQTIEHRLGVYYIQDAASMLPAELFTLDDLEDPLILDMAASPGGKTTHIASRVNDRGVLIANDSSRDRIVALRMVLQNWGAISSAVTQFPGEKFGPWFPETFDRILLDAPCSMENLRSTATHRMRPITSRERDNLSKRQSQLLASALAALKVGGQVVYSTCTLAPEEDEAVLDRLLKKYPGMFRVEDVTSHLPIPAPGFAADEKHVFNPLVENAVRLFPHQYHSSGFFAALLRKEASLPLSTETPPSRPLEGTSFTPLSAAENTELSRRMQDAWGFDMPAILETHQLQIWKNEQRTFAFPLAYLSRFADFPCKSLGLVVGEGKGDEFQPAIEWISRFSRHFTNGILRIPPEQIESWARGEDLPAPTPTQAEGSILVVQDEDGRFLGTGKFLSDRLRNLLPRRAVLST